MIPDPSSDSAARHACRELLGLETTKTTRLSHASRSTVHRVDLEKGRTVIVKLYFGADGWKAKKEQKIIEVLRRDSTIRTADVIGCGPLKSRNAVALVTADLGGCSLLRMVHEKACSYRAGLRTLGQLLADFHQTSLPRSVTTHPNREERKTTEDMFSVATDHQLAMLRRESCSALADHIEPAFRWLMRACRQGGPRVLCHGDLHLANVLCTSEKELSVPHVVDFEATTYCVSEYDLAKSIVTSSALAQEDRQALLRGYNGRSYHSVREQLLFAFIVFHVVEGWLYAALLEKRDRSLWRSRVNQMLLHYAPLFDH